MIDIKETLETLKKRAEWFEASAKEEGDRGRYSMAACQKDIAAGISLAVRLIETELSKKETANAEKA